MDESSSSDADSLLNRGCLLDSDDSLHGDLSIFVPETPSPQPRKRRRRGHVTQEESPAASRPCLERSSGSAPRDLPPPCKRRKPPADVSAPSCSRTSCGGAELEATQGSSGLKGAGPPRDSLSFLTEEERRWLSSEQQTASMGRGQILLPPCDFTAEQIVISDDEEGLLRTVQLEEDEALARSLQAQFDQEEVESYSRQHQQQMFFPSSQSGWMPHLLAAVSPLVAFDNGLAGGGRRRGRSRRRNMVDSEFSDDPQGNNYEALLEFEERQGAVVSRKLTHQQIQRFPVQTFQPGADGGRNTQCQICFCDYTGGEKLRMLPCFHDYHVRCIDRWLKDNTTCPICRSNLADL